MLPAGQTEELGAPNSQNSESRVLDVFGPNFLIETNGAVGVAGQLKYQYILSQMMELYINKHFMVEMD